MKHVITAATQRLQQTAADAISDTDLVYGAVAFLLIQTEGMSERLKSTKEVLAKIENKDLVKRLKALYKNGYFLDRINTLKDLKDQAKPKFGFHLEQGSTDDSISIIISKSKDLDVDVDLLKRADKDFRSFEG